MTRMTRPPEITPDEWDMLTSPENYYMDGEVSRAQADRIFRQRVSSIVKERRAAKKTPTPPQRRNMPAPSRKCSASTAKGGMCARDAEQGFQHCWQHRKPAQRSRWR